MDTYNADLPLENTAVFVLFVDKNAGSKYLTALQVNLTRTWLTVSSLLLSFVFVFGNSIRAIYESVVYLFVVRPFDVGDVILLGPAQDWCTVGSRSKYRHAHNMLPCLRQPAHLQTSVTSLTFV